MDNQKHIEYSRVEAYTQKLNEVNSLLDSSKLKVDAIELDHEKTKGCTGKQALCGFRNSLSKSLVTIEQLSEESKTFFKNLCMQFEEADEEIANRIGEK